MASNQPSWSPSETLYGVTLGSSLSTKNVLLSAVAPATATCWKLWFATYDGGRRGSPRASAACVFLHETELQQRLRAAEVSNSVLRRVRVLLIFSFSR
jgi:hypothetical protein